ncbi:TPA: hypothetical protein ACQT2M_006655, partial [Pseudomonas aeruginosa]
IEDETQRAIGTTASIGYGFNKSDTCLVRGRPQCFSEIARQDLSLRLGIVFCKRHAKGDSANESSTAPLLPPL